MKKDFDFIFIGGAGRSGTSLVQKLLLSNLEISGGPEFYFTKPIFELLANMQSELQTGVVHESFDTQKLRRHFIDFYSFFLEPYQESDTRYISEKTPSNLEVARTLLHTFPKSTFIHVFRDGRAVVNSHLKVKKRAKQSGKYYHDIGLWKTSKYWIRYMALADELKAEFPDRFLEVQYEELIEEPIPTLSPIFDHLTLKMNPELKDPASIELKGNKKDAHINDIWYTREMYSKGYDTSRKEGWRKESSYWSQLVLNGHLFEGLRSKGYEVSSAYQPLNQLIYFASNWKSILKRWWIARQIAAIKRRILN